MATRKYRSAESLTPVASHEEMRRYPKTGVIAPEFRLYIEGISIPFVSISISESFRGLPSANIEIPYFAGLTEICKNYAPKVNIFFRDTVYEKYLIEKGITDYSDGDIFRSLFDGVLLTSSYSRSKSADGGSAQIVFACVHKYSFLNQILIKFGGRGSQQVAPGSNAETTAVSNYLTSLAAILEALAGIEKTSVYHVNKDTTDTQEVNVRALSPDMLPYHERLMGVPGVSMVLWNTLKRDSYVFRKYTKTMTEMYIPLVDEGLKFFKRMTGHPLIERGMEIERIPVRSSDLANKVQGFSPISQTTDLLVPANYRNFINEAVAVDVAISLSKVGEQSSGETMSLYGMIQANLENMTYDIQVLASAVQSNNPNLESVDSVVKPLLPFYFSPTCNVLLPHMYSSISVQDGSNISPTRLVSFPDILYTSDNREPPKQEYRAPHIVRLVTVLNNPLGETTLNASTVRHGEYPAPHEFGRGMLVKEIGIKPWIKHLFSSYKAVTETESQQSDSAAQTSSSPSTDSSSPVSPITNPTGATAAPKTVSYSEARVIDVEKSPKENRPEAIWKHWNIKTNPIPFYYGSLTKKGNNVVYGKQGVATPGSVESLSIETFRNTTKVPAFWTVIMFPYNSSMYAYPPHYDYVRRQWFPVEEIPTPFKSKYVYVYENADSSGSSKLRPGNPVAANKVQFSISKLTDSTSIINNALIGVGVIPTTPEPTPEPAEEPAPYWDDPILDLLKATWDKENPGQSSLNPYATTEENGSQPYEMTLMNTLDYEYSLALVENKQGSVEGLFNPFIVPGYPMDIIDPSPERPSYHAFCVAKTHSITPRSCSTSITFSSALSYDELRSYELPSILPWFQKHLHFIQKQSLINQTIEAQQAANNYYFGVFGCGFADPTLLENDQTNSINFLKVDKKGDFEVTLNRANLSEKGSMDNMLLGFIDQNLSYEGNLALVRREIETLSDIEASRGIRFVDVLPTEGTPLPDVTSKAEVSALRPDVLVKPGRSVFLSYDRLDAAIWKLTAAKLSKAK